ncbi:MAG: alkaline phosphatase D family protein, partial [Bacteroidales bacterium]|nr:alkaline phosphatase D family protein [Bacteroidales bacterium]
TTDGKLFIGKFNSTQKPIPNISLDEITIEMTAIQQSDGKYTITVGTHDQWDAKTHRHVSINNITRKNIPSNWIEGGIALMCHNGPLVEFPDKRKFTEYPTWGTAKGTQRSGNIRFGFSEWKISGEKISFYKNRAFGPILFAQYTLSKGTLKITAQMPPIGEKDGQTVDFQTKAGIHWKTISQVFIDSISRTATFKIEDWDSFRDTPYRLVYNLYSSKNKLKEYYYEGTIRKEPLDKDEIVVAAFTGNNDLGFPNNDIVESVKYHNPDLLFFSGDQIYEGVGGYGVQRSPLDKSVIDYLRKWYLYGWAYGELMRNRPSVAIPDDHDVYHGNIWGAGGIATPEGLAGGHAQDMGGYKMPAEWVNMVQRTQTSHLPDPYDPIPVAQGIQVYYTDLNYAGVSFAIIEDRKFKSAPKTLLPEADIYNGWAQNKTYNEAANSDVDGAVLLGQRQLDFLENWSADWSNNTWMKVLLSQTIFANVATLPKPESHSDAIVPKLRILKKGEYPPNDIPVADFDANSWPQTGRNKALESIRKSFAFHIAGDQHLGSTIQYGIDDWHDAGFAFCVPSISNVWPRRWFPATGGKNKAKDVPKYTGDFTDGFGNKMSVYAVSNPIYTGEKPSRLYDRATGYGIVRFNKTTRDITVECWPRQENPETESQYQGWPITINQQDNYLKNATLFLPELIFEGINNPIVQVINEDSNEIIFTLRVNGQSYRPKVMADGNYSIIISGPETDNEKILHHINTTINANQKTINVIFK